jgi:heme-degrading monooxygenase HmoA
MIAKTPKAPYYAVIFTSLLAENNDGYEDMANQMFALAEKQEGFLGMESVRDGMGISVSYWDSLDNIRKWSRHSDHSKAKEMGKNGFYKEFKTRICKVEMEY